MRPHRSAARLAPLLLLAMVTACGASDPTAGQAAPPAAISPAATAPPSAVAAPPATPTPVQVPDFNLVAYQGDATIGGHDGHFAAAFAAGKPVVLLYYGGL